MTVKKDNSKNDIELQEKLEKNFGSSANIYKLENINDFSVEDFFEQMRELNAPEDIKEESELRELIAAIEQVYSDKNLEKKTRLTSRNIKGIIQLCAMNRYFNDKFNFRVNIFDEIIVRKCRLNISLNGKGREEMLKLFDALGSAFSEQRNIGLWSRLMGKGNQ